MDICGRCVNIHWKEEPHGPRDLTIYFSLSLRKECEETVSSERHDTMKVHAIECGTAIARQLQPQSQGLECSGLIELHFYR